MVFVKVDASLKVEVACNYCDWVGSLSAKHDAVDCAKRQIELAIAPLVKRIEALEKNDDATGIGEEG